MAISYYDEILRRYDQKQFSNAKKLQEITKKIYFEIPRIKEIDTLITDLSIEKAIASVSDSSLDLTSYKNKILKLNQEKAFLLEKNGYNSSCMEPEYSCSVCKDTGFVNGTRCSCLKQEILNQLYNQSNIKKVLCEENFDTFSFSYYSNEKKDKTTNLTPLENIKEVVTVCKSFINKFDASYDNLFLYGEAGVGKTFLTNCIARDLLEKYHSVVYISAIKLFDIFSDFNFKNNPDSDSSSLTVKTIFESDLLIIDDLGTELVNSFTVSQFFNCINERLLSKKHVIISTNLSIEQLQKTYSERIFSRIISNYTLLKIYGDDIRMKKKLED